MNTLRIFFVKCSRLDGRMSWMRCFWDKQAMRAYHKPMGQTFSTRLVDLDTSTWLRIHRLQVFHIWSWKLCWIEAIVQIQKLCMGQLKQKLEHAQQRKIPPVSQDYRNPGLFQANIHSMRLSFRLCNQKCISCLRRCHICHNHQSWNPSKLFPIPQLWHTLDCIKLLCYLWTKHQSHGQQAAKKLLYLLRYLVRVTLPSDQLCFP